MTNIYTLYKGTNLLENRHIYCMLIVEASAIDSAQIIRFLKHRCSTLPGKKNTWIKDPSNYWCRAVCHGIVVGCFILIQQSLQAQYHVRALLTADAIVGDLQVLDHATAFHAELRRLKVFLLGRFQLLQFLVHLRVQRKESVLSWSCFNS